MKNTWLELDFNIFEKNLCNLKNALGNNVEIIFVVKSDAYGHGMIPVAKQAENHGVKWFAVVHIEEALALRKALPNVEIVILSPIIPSDTAKVVKNNLIPAIVSKKHALALALEAESINITVRCHVNVDTGMGRLGFVWGNAADDIEELMNYTGLDIHGIYTHFAASDCDRTFTEIQAERFQNVLLECEKRDISIPFKHMSNSGAIQLDNKWDISGVRTGILLYGYGSNAVTPKNRPIETKPFLQWKTRVMQVREVPAGFTVSYGYAYKTERKTCIAAINVGYADGYPRSLSNKGQVIVGGKRHPVIGRVTMNVILIDLGSVTDVKEGDEVILIGSQGNESIWADEIAGWLNTIPYEVLTNIRVKLNTNSSIL